MFRPDIKEDVFDGPPDGPGSGMSVQMSTTGIVHDLGNLIQVASSALNHLARDPSIQAAPALGPVIAGRQNGFGTGRGPCPANHQPRPREPR